MPHDEVDDIFAAHRRTPQSPMLLELPVPLVLPELPVPDVPVPVGPLTMSIGTSLGVHAASVLTTPARRNCEKLNATIAKLSPRLAAKLEAMQAGRQQYDEPPRDPEGTLDKPGESRQVRGSSPTRNGAPQCSLTGTPPPMDPSPRRRAHRSAGTQVPLRARNEYAASARRMRERAGCSQATTWTPFSKANARRRTKSQGGDHEGRWGSEEADRGDPECRPRAVGSLLVHPRDVRLGALWWRAFV
jgi:hypothetical protein